MITHTIIGVLIMFCFYKTLKLLGNLIKLISQLRYTINPKPLNEELNNLSDFEFQQWCVEYLTRNGYKTFNESNCIKARYYDDTFHIMFLKGDKVDDRIVSILIGKQLLMNGENILLLTNKKLEIHKDEVKKMTQFGIKIIDGSYFNESYEGYVKNRVVIPKIGG